MKTIPCTVIAIGLCAAQAAAQSGDPMNVYEVQPGDTLLSISSEVFGDEDQWLKLVRANEHLFAAAGAVLVAGQRIRIPPPGASDDGKTVFLVTGNDYQPYADEGLEQGGMVTEIVQRVFDRLGFQPDVRYIDWSDGYELTRDRGVFAGTFPYLKNDERLEDFYYSDPLYQILIMPFYMLESGMKFENSEDIVGKIVCRPKGYFTHDIQPLIDAGDIRHVAPESPAACFRMLEREEVDLVSINEATGQRQIRSLGMTDDVLMGPEVMSTESLHVIFPRHSVLGSKALRDAFNEAFFELEAEGVIAEIEERHLLAFYNALPE